MAGLLLVNQATRTVLRLLHNEAVVTKLFDHHRTAFWPGTKSLRRVVVEFPSAFSHDSALSVIHLDLMNKEGRTIKKTVRGNVVPGIFPAVLERLQAIKTFGVPRPLWYQTKAHYFFYESLAGERYRDIPFRSARFAKVTADIGSALARLHQVRSNGLPTTLAASTEKQLLVGWNKTIQRARLNTEPLLLLGVAKLATWLRTSWGAGPRVISHNDFQGSNILVQKNGRIGIIDFSRSGRGPLLLDVGQFLAHFRVMTAPYLLLSAQNRLQTKFIANYRRGLTTPQRRLLERDLWAAELRASLDIVAITCAHIQGKQRDIILAPLYATLPRLIQH